MPLLTWGYITIRVKPTFAFAPYFEHPPHFLPIYSEMRPISPKTMIYQNDRIHETVVVSFFLRLELITSYKKKKLFEIEL